MHHLLLHRQITLLKQHNEKQRTNEPWAAPEKEEKQSKKKVKRGKPFRQICFSSWSLLTYTLHHVLLSNEKHLNSGTGFW